MQLSTHVFLFRQTVSEWSGSNAVVHSCVPVQTNIRYCVVIDGSPTEFRTDCVHRHEECAIHDDTRWSELQCHYI